MEVELAKCKKVAVAYSGGLDSALCIRLLFDKYGAEEVLPVTVNVGLPDWEIEDAKSKAELLGVPWQFIEATDEFADQWIAKAVQANSSYGGYPVATSMTRQLIAQKVAEYAVEQGCDAICEGSTGKGNDQFRMHNVFSIFAPGLTVIVPVRDFNFTRQEEKELSKEYGIPHKEGIGDDLTMWCRSIGSGEVDNIHMRLPESDYIWYKFPENAPDKKTTIEIEFSNGLPVSCDGKKTLTEIIHYLNEVAGANGIGKLDLMEDGMIGLKSREAYEAPAAEVILKLHRDLEAMCLTKEERQFKAMVDQQWAYLVYHGAWFHPLKDELDGFIERSQKHVEGWYKVDLYKGNVDIVDRESPYSLFKPEIRSLATEGWDQRESSPAVKIHSMQYQILGRRGL
ncbi:MAG: argininosuccinate synthase [Armatimonadota bacterium]